MDATRFDVLTRAFSSRRTVVRGLVGGGIANLLGRFPGGDVAGAAPNRCPRGKKKCGKRCIPKQQPCCKGGMKRCGPRCIAKSKCCTNADCGARRLCAKGTCVTGQGTCPPGANTCIAAAQCGPSGTSCGCRTSTANKTRCGDSGIISGQTCGECFTDADCAAAYSEIPGVFCSTMAGGCSCAGSTLCTRPCPD